MSCQDIFVLPSFAIVLRRRNCLTELLKLSCPSYIGLPRIASVQGKSQKKIFCLTKYIKTMQSQKYQLIKFLAAKLTEEKYSQVKHFLFFCKQTKEQFFRVNQHRSFLVSQNHICNRNVRVVICVLSSRSKSLDYISNCFITFDLNITEIDKFMSNLFQICNRQFEIYIPL